MTLLRDLRFALRRLLQAPGFSLAVLLMLALGIALSATMLGVLRGVLGSLPYPQADQVVVVEASSAELDVQRGGLSPAEAIRLAEPDSPFAHFGYYDWNGMTVTQSDRAREITTIRVSPGFFPALGMPPLLGRWIAEADIDAADAVVLSHGEWQRLFGGDPQVIGRALETTAGRLQVVGVMPAGFNIPSDAAGAWRPLPRDAFPLDQPWTWHARFVSAVARLDPAVAEQALAQTLDARIAEVAKRHGLPPRQWQVRGRPLLDVIVGDLRGVLWAAFAVALLVLLIACANVAILVDARQVARRHEQAVVQALGASRQRLYRSLLLEIAVLTGLGVLLGVGLAMLGIDALRELARSSLPRVDDILIDPLVLGASAALGLLVPLVATLAGALRPRAEAAEAMRSGGKGVVGGASRRGWLPLAGVALSTVSLIAGSALLFSLWRLQAVDPGLRHHNVYALQLFHENGLEQRRDFARRLQARLAALPSVEQVAVSSAAPMSPMGNFSIDIKLPERSEPEPYRLNLRRVSNEFPALLGIRAVAGRLFGDAERSDGEKVAVVNRELARRLFGEGEAVNRIVELPLADGPRVAYRIVGVSENFHNQGLRARTEPELWVPFEPAPSVGMTFLVGSRKPIAGVDRRFADALHEIDRNEAATLVFPLSESVDEQLAASRFFARTVGGFALAALLLAAFGVYAVASLRQQQRVAEFGLRLAIGAHPRTLVAQMLGDSARPVFGGIALGLFGAWAVLRVLQSQLFGVDGIEPGVIGSGVGLLLLAALLAALLPAVRAARTDPMRALREH